MRNLVIIPVMIGVLGGLSGCNSASSLLSSAKDEPKVTISPDQPTIVNPLKTKTLSSTSGNRILALVNEQPVTSGAVRRRAAFLKLRRTKGNRSKLALDELVDEKIKMAEARRFGRIPDDKQVDAAYARFASANKMPVKILNQIMTRSGVTVRGFKEYIRAQIAWQGVVGLRAQSGGIKPRVAAAGPLDHLHGGGNKARAANATEYTIKQIVFVVPKDQLAKASQRRISEANAYRTRYSGCEGALKQAALLKNVTVLDRGRVQAHELPPRWKVEIEKTQVGQLTRPLKTEKGVEMIGVCKTREVLSTEKKGPDGLFSGDGKPDNSAVAKLEKDYLAELKKKATIVYR